MEEVEPEDLATTMGASTEEDESVGNGGGGSAVTGQRQELRRKKTGFMNWQLQHMRCQRTRKKRRGQEKGRRRYLFTT